MSTRNQFILMTLIFVLVIGYGAFVRLVIWPKHPEWDTTGKLEQQTNSQVQSAPTPPPSSATTVMSPSEEISSMSPTTGPTSAPTGGLTAVAAAPSVMDAAIGSVDWNDPLYRLGLHISAGDGAGLASVTINQSKSADAKNLYEYQKPYDDALHDLSLATRDVVVDGRTVDLLNTAWGLVSMTKDLATFAVDIVDSGSKKPVVHISKTFALQKRDEDDNSSGGYEVAVVYHVQDLDKQAHTVSLEFAGPTMPPREIERSDDRLVATGYDKGNQVVTLVRNALTDFKPGTDGKAWKDLTRSDKGDRILWTGMTSVYFSAIIHPENPEQIGSVIASVLNPSADADQREIAMDIKTADLSLGAGAGVDVPLKVFIGPKNRPLLEGNYYGDYPREYDQLFSSSSGICALCASSWLTDRLVDLLRLFHFILRDWGLAIIALVVVVRLALHPITKNSQVSMMKMQKMAPELERLKKKYGDDKEGFAKAQMQLYKGMGVTPILGCLPMFLQMPIWIALYSALQNEIRLRQAPFFYGITWIHDLARPDRLVTWDTHAFTLPLIGKIVSLNVLPLMLAVVFFLQQKMQPQPPAMTPEQESQRKMMQWMSLIFPVFLYTAPSGLNVYILTSTTIGILENKRIRDHIKQREEAEKSQVVIIDAKPTRAGKQNKQDSQTKGPEKLGWWATLQQRVEDMKREAEKKRRG